MKCWGSSQEQDRFQSQGTTSGSSYQPKQVRCSGVLFFLPQSFVCIFTTPCTLHMHGKKQGHSGTKEFRPSPREVFISKYPVLKGHPHERKFHHSQMNLSDSLEEHKSANRELGVSVKGLKLGPGFSGSSGVGGGGGEFECIHTR